MPIPVFPTLSKNPDRDKFKFMHRDGLVVTDAAEGGGYNFTRPLTTRRPKAWEIGYTQMTDADITAMQTFVDVTVLGESLAFTWTHPLTGATYTVRFRKGSLPSYPYENFEGGAVGNRWSISTFVIEEV